jgi:hypothetical protein
LIAGDRSVFDFRVCLAAGAAATANRRIQACFIADRPGLQWHSPCALSDAVETTARGRRKMKLNLDTIFDSNDWLWQLFVIIWGT